MGNESSSEIAVDETFSEGGHFRVHIKLYEGFDPAERSKLREACQMWVSVWQTREFKDWLLTYEFEDTALSNAAIYEKLLGGVFGVSVVDNVADISIWAKHDMSGTVVNTTFVHDGKQWMGTKHLMTYSAPKLAGYLAHEYCKYLQFLHTGITSPRSVPFAVGKKTKRLAELAAYSFAENALEESFQEPSDTDLHQD